MQENYEIFKDLTQTVGLLYKFYCIKKKLWKWKKSSENDQSTGHFQSFFLFFRPLNPKSEKKFP